VIELIKGKPINEVKKLTEHDILNKMGGLPKEEIDFVTCNIYSKK
jgi:NifU-like protein involved in Fe-S cluster formation